MFSNIACSLSSLTGHALRVSSSFSFSQRIPHNMPKAQQAPQPPCCLHRRSRECCASRLRCHSQLRCQELSSRVFFGWFVTASAEVVGSPPMYSCMHTRGATTL